MLWYKAWLDSRGRFLIGLALLMLSACGVVISYSQVQAMIPLVPVADGGGEIGRLIREAAELAQTYRGYVWSQWYRQNLVQTWTLFAAILGTGGLVSQASGGGALFTLSLPVTRTHLLAVRVATGLLQLFLLALLPSLLLATLSPAVGQATSFADALVHGACLFVAGTAFYSLTILLSTIFADIWRPLLISFSLALGLALIEQFARGPLPYSVLHAMTGESYFRSGAVPWPGLFIGAVLSAVLLFAASRNLARRDF